jgi:fructan beta-fructosidase
VLKVDVFDGHVSGSTGSQYFVGHFDGERFTLRPGQAARWSDFGADFYAALSWNNLPQGAAGPVWIGWMNNHRYAQTTPTQPWRGAMSQPRRLSLRADAHGLVLVQEPLAQLAARRTGRTQIAGMRVERGEHAWPLPRMQYDIEARFALRDAREFGLRLGAADGDHTLIGYQAGTVFVDRSRSGLMTDHPHFTGRRAARVEPAVEPSTELRLRILVDNCSVEVFVNDGAAVITELVFPTTPAATLALYAVDGGVDLLSLDLWQLA